MSLALPVQIRAPRDVEIGLALLDTTPIAHAVLETRAELTRLERLRDEPRIPDVVRRPRLDREELLECTHVFTEK